MKNDQCKETVYRPLLGFISFGHQCTRKIWKDGYCKIHHPATVDARNRKRQTDWEEKREQDPLMNALKRIKKLTEENDRLKNEIFDLERRIK